MKQFANLFQKLDSTTKTNAKIDALVEFLTHAEDRDKVWAIALLSHRRPPRAVNTNLLREWASEVSNLPMWLFEESYHIVGDLAETIALLTPENPGTSALSLADWMEFMIQLKPKSEERKKKEIQQAWTSLNRDERFLFNKLITGGLRVGVSQKLMTKALSKYTGKEENHIAHRLMGKWDPRSMDFNALVLSDHGDDEISKPYPFFLAYALDSEPESLGDVNDWIAERKWDGIRGQMIVRDHKLFVWSRGEELVTDKYPEFHPLAELIPHGTVMDGEIMAYKNDRPLPFQDLQRRIGRKTVAKSHLTKYPVVMIVYDLLEYQGEDVRQQPLHWRRDRLKEILRSAKASTALILSRVVKASNWQTLIDERERSRELSCEGLMLKRRNSVYQVGRKRGDWWKWKVDPFEIDAVMIYAQRGHGRRANLYTDFTFAVWDGDKLVPFAKAYSGLTDREFREITRFVRTNTIERFGPVNAVKPQLVFQLHFEGIAKSKRHKSGIALRFPRIHKWRKTKHPKEANTLEDLMSLLNSINPKEL